MTIPQNIQQLADKVRNEIYGRDVRESIAQSMEATAEVAEWSREVAQGIIDGTFDEGLLSTEIENKLNQLEQDYAPTLTAIENEVTDARGNEATLGAKMDNITSQLAHIAYNLNNLPSGETNDASVFLQNLLDIATANKVKKITFPKNTYRLNSPIFIKGDDIELDFSGSTILSYANATANKRAEIGIINAHGEMLDSNVDIVTYLRSIYPNQHTPPANAPVLISIENVNGSTSRVVTSNNSYFVVGDDVLLKGWTRPTTFPYSANTYEPELHVLAKVVNVDANYVYIDYASPLRFPNFVDNSVFKSRMMKVRTVKNVSIKNVTIKDMTQVATRGTMTSAELLQATCGISPLLVDNFKLENVTVENHRQPAVYPYCARNLHFKNVHGEKPQSWEVGGYVLCFMTSRDIVLEHITGDSCRHIIDFSTSSNNARIYDSYGVNSYASDFTSHGQCEHDIYYFNSKGRLGFGSGLAEFPNINSNYTFNNCDLDLVTVVDDSKWVNNVLFDNCEIKTASNPTFLNLDIRDSTVIFTNGNHQPSVNRRSENVNTSFKLKNVEFEFFIPDSSKNLVYFLGYDTLTFEDTEAKLDTSGFLGIITFIIDGTKYLKMDNFKSEYLRYRYSNTKHTKAVVSLVDSDLKNTANYLFAVFNMTNCELFFTLKDSEVEQNDTIAAPLNIFYVLQGNLGTMTNSRIRGYIHNNYLIGRTEAQIHGVVNTGDDVFTHDNMIVNLASGSIFDNTRNNVVS